jgi:sugar-specific transcriptional regulator TrmB
MGVKKQLSLNRALKALKSLGLTEIDVQVYVYLSKRGPHGLNDLADALKVTNHRLSFSLENLRTRNMVDFTSEPSIRFYAIPLEQVLDDLMKAAKEQAKALQTSKEKLLRVWHDADTAASSNN